MFSRIRKLQWLFLIPIAAFALSCDIKSQEEPTSNFVLNDSDYPLDCNPDFDTMDAYSCQLAYYANRDRAANQDESDLALPLKWNDDLAAVAQAYSEEMCSLEFFDHVDTEGDRVGDRLGEAGIAWVKAGENLARGESFLPEEAEDMFMDEPSCQENHRKNILDNDFTDIGVGARDCGDVFIYTEVFATFDVADLRADPNEFCLGN